VGTWGTGIFSDDTAADVRGQFRDAIGDGLTPEAATRRLLEHYKPGPHDPDGTPVFWIALAVTQWKTGRLLESVKREALRVIADGSDLARWSDPNDTKRRTVELEKVSRLLASPQPPTKRIRKRWLEECDWKRGELVIYRTAAGALVHFRVVGFAIDAGGKRPVCEVLDLPGAARLDDASVRAAPLVHFLKERDSSKPRSLVMLAALGPRELPRRIERPGIVTKATHLYEDPLSHPNQRAWYGGFKVVLWRNADRSIETLYGIA
jgi:hypothetical protein